jgi:hypothetical protein
MAKKEKRLCGWKKKYLSENLEELFTIVREPKFACEKCGRVANKKKWLHKPVSIK